MADAHPGTHREDDVRRRALPDAGAGHWLLLVPIVAPLLTPVYNRIEPRLFGMPFFYWFQLGFALLSTVVIMVVHLTKRRD
jgi:Protein of unknown function (DUF3311)